MDKKILVTAGASGIGLEIVRAFLASGARVYTCDIASGPLERAADELPGLHTGICDIGDHIQIAEMVAGAAKVLGGIDILVNNAGISGPTKPIQDIEPEEWEAVIRVDLTGAFNVTRNAVPHLIRSGGGAIINIASSAGRFGYPNRSPYAAAKWGLVGLTKTLSMELGKYSIRVNAISPGAVEGERIRRVLRARAEATGQSLEAVEQDVMANQSIKRLVDPADVAALAVFLASDAGKSISGQVLPVDNDKLRL